MLKFPIKGSYLAAQQLSSWELSMQSIYFIIAMASDWLVGHEGTLLGAQSDGLGLRYPHHCRGWRFHLARVDKQSERLLRARDQLFALVYPLCLSTVVLYWAVIIPTQADERVDAFRNGLTVVETVLSHGAQRHCAYHSSNILTRSYSKWCSIRRALYRRFSYYA